MAGGFKFTPKKVDSPWYYKLEKHRQLYASLIITGSFVLLGVAGHDVSILRDIAHGDADLNALHYLYLNITDYSTVFIMGIIADIGIVSGIAYAIIIAIAHHKIARDRVGYRLF